MGIDHPRMLRGGQLVSIQFSASVALMPYVLIHA